MGTAFEYSCGETMEVALDITGGTGSISDVASITAQIRKSARGVRVVDPEAALIATLSVSARPHVNGQLDGWILSLPAATTATLVPGYYLIDARITLNSGGVIITDQLPVQLIPAVTR